MNNQTIKEIGIGLTLAAVMAFLFLLLPIAGSYSLIDSDPQVYYQEDGKTYQCGVFYAPNSIVGQNDAMFERMETHCESEGFQCITWQTKEVGSFRSSVIDCVYGEGVHPTQSNGNYNCNSRNEVWGHYGLTELGNYEEAAGYCESLGKYDCDVTWDTYNSQYHLKCNEKSIQRCYSCNNDNVITTMDYTCDGIWSDVEPDCVGADDNFGVTLIEYDDEGEVEKITTTIGDEVTVEFDETVPEEVVEVIVPDEIVSGDEPQKGLQIIYLVAVALIFGIFLWIMGAKK